MSRYKATNKAERGGVSSAASLRVSLSCGDWMSRRVYNAD